MQIKNAIDKKGRLLPELKPAAYVDSSVLIELYLTEGSEYKDLEDPPRVMGDEKFARALFGIDKELREIINLRSRIYNNEIRTTIVYSPLAMIELIEVVTEAALKEMAASAIGFKRVVKRGRKDVGGLLDKFIEKHGLDIYREQFSYSTPEEMYQFLLSDIGPRRKYTVSVALSDLVQADIRNFDLSHPRVWSDIYQLAFLQLDPSDIIHVLLCEHLNCDYFVTIDSDFVRAKPFFEQYDIQLIYRRGELNKLP
jgi:hypothetical protein